MIIVADESVLIDACDHGMIQSRCCEIVDIAFPFGPEDCWHSMILDLYRPNQLAIGDSPNTQLL